MARLLKAREMPQHILCYGGVDASDGFQIVERIRQIGAVHHGGTEKSYT